MVNNILKLWLYSTQEVFLIPLITIGFWINRRRFGRPTLLLFFAMVTNVCLKMFFGVPLAWHLHKAGYSFPSGHLLVAFVFWFELALVARTWSVLVLSLTIVAGDTIGLLYFRYHNIWDILGAINFGLIILIISHFIHRKIPLTLWPFVGFFWLLLVGLLCKFVEEALPLHTYLALGGLFGFSCGWSCTKNIPTEQYSAKNKSLLILITFGLVALTYYLFSFFSKTSFVVFFRYSLITFLASGGFLKLYRPQK